MTPPPLPYRESRLCCDTAFPLRAFVDGQTIFDESRSTRPKQLRRAFDHLEVTRFYDNISCRSYRCLCTTSLSPHLPKTSNNPFLSPITHQSPPSFPLCLFSNARASERGEEEKRVRKYRYQFRSSPSTHQRWLLAFSAIHPPFASFARSPLPVLLLAASNHSGFWESCGLQNVYSSASPQFIQLRNIETELAATE